ncbi:MAG: hypothetical protein ACR2FU_03890 [Streptosporangiaceae bacterium]
MTVHGGTPDDTGEVRAALASIVADPDYGAGALTSRRTMESLLKDLLPDRPRDAAILVAAAEHGLATSLSERVEQEGMDAGVAVRLVAASFGRATAFTPEACQWAATELAGALGMDTATIPAALPFPSRSEPATAQPGFGQPGYGPPGPAWPAGFTGQGPARRRRTPLIIAAAGVALVVIAVLVVVLVPKTSGPAPMITAAASSSIAPAAGNVFVYYQDPGLARATIAGTVSHGARGEVAALTAQPFPFTAAPHVLARTPLAGRNQDLSFLVTPSLETRYRIEVLPSDASTPLATSAARTVYVALVAHHVYAQNSCPRPACHVTLRLTVPVAPAALHAEGSKRIYFYWAIHLAPAGPEPSDPVTLKLRSLAASPPVTLSRGEYQVSISFSFTVGQDAYRWHWNACTRDDVTSDGIGLPGSHPCGNPTIPAAPSAYLGSMSG